ncbi:MAG TPA: ABC transporter permease [Niabella sp.]|jgi:ABC-2 type transport system permease protein|nr:ABC transporter permease [Chitinophagaceae bacterium]HRO85987.1 ABC transporter permease [Niabella sp.]
MRNIFRSLKFALIQIGGYFTGEVKEIFRDGGTIVVFLLAMIAYPIIYALGYIKETAKEIPVALVDLNHSATSEKLGRMIDATEQIKISYKPTSLNEAEKLYYKNEVMGVIVIDKDFEKNILSANRGAISVYSDAGHFLLYKQVYSGVVYASQTLNAGIEVRNLLTKGKTMEQAMEQRDPLSLKVNNLYNPSGGYASFIVPAILIILIQQTLLIGIGILYGKHNERNNFHYLKEGAKRPFEAMKIVLGQTLAFMLIYLFTSFLILGLFYHIVGFPDKTGFLKTYYLLIPYLAAISFLGIGIGLLFPKRVYALLFLVFLSPPILFISGAVWPAEALPRALYYASYLLPSTPMINGFIRLRIMNSGLHAISTEYNILIIQMVAYFLMTISIYRIKLKRLRKQLAW